jgi:hypothetical protein
LWQANDPLVHYLASDLNYMNPGWQQSSDPQNSPLPVTSQNTPGQRFQPWGLNKQMAGLNNVDVNAFNLAYKDPLVWCPENWDFPTNRYPTVGWLGRVHRGTPWQTVFLKATNILNYANGNGLTTWVDWSGDVNSFDAANSRPTQDHLLFDLFTTRLNDNAAHGTLSVNVGAGRSDGGLAAWSALFSGMVALSNNLALPSYTVRPSTTWANINPVGVNQQNSALWKIVNGINNTRTNTALFPLGCFQNVGDILATPQLTEQSPFLNTNAPLSGVFKAYPPLEYAISDEVYEWLPQQALGLLRASGTTRYVVYCYGQTLRPAVGGTVLSGNYFNLVTNYQITAESAARAVIRVDRQVTATGTNYSTVVESFNPLPPN